MNHIARCITDHRMTITDADDAFADIVHHNLPALRGSNVYDLTHPDDLATNRRFLDELRADGTPFSITKRYIRANGVDVWVRNHVSVYNQSGDKVQLLATVQTVQAPNKDQDDELTALAEAILKCRAARLGMFDGVVFGEPEYDILLDLYVHTKRGCTVTVSSACIAAMVPATTALRHIDALVTNGWLVRKSDPFDRRKTHLHLTPDGEHGIEQYLRLCQRIRWA